MNLYVCIKQVPDDQEKVTLTADGSAEVSSITPVVNAFDTYSLEMAARFKEASEGEITVVTIGGSETVPSLRSCLAVGADHALRIDGAPGLSTYEKACAMAEALADKPFDIIMCGRESTDMISGQFGVALAEIMGLSVITDVIALEKKADGSVAVHQETELGYKEFEINSKCVLTVSTPDYQPRYPSMKSKIAARKMPVDEQACAAATMPDPVKKALFTPDVRSGGIKIKENDSTAAVEKAAALLKEQGLI